MGKGRNVPSTHTLTEDDAASMALIEHHRAAFTEAAYDEYQIQGRGDIVVSSPQVTDEGVSFMNFRLMPIVFHSSMACFACGERLEPDVEIAIAYTPTGVELGPICTRCVESDVTQLRRRVERHVITIREGLAVLEHLVDEGQALTRCN